jgi:hypothetical protein
LTMVAITFANASRLAGRSLIRKKYLQLRSNSRIRQRLVSID